MAPPELVQAALSCAFDFLASTISKWLLGMTVDEIT
jgi:hypothetical protein